ncbi:MAG: hypothetical protein HC849_07450 [Oscillatoriales cyanobacterium RU_3_3]|nr:hypothetical protein [Oscillatoriales cyanobacterium RU_3_3]
MPDSAFTTYYLPPAGSRNAAQVPENIAQQQENSNRAQNQQPENKPSEPVEIPVPEQNARTSPLRTATVRNSDSRNPANAPAATPNAAQTSPSTRTADASGTADSTFARDSRRYDRN